MEVYKTIKRSVSATANGIIASTRFTNNSNSSSASNNLGSHSWIHPPDALINGRVEYAVKMLGQVEANEPKGTHIVRDAIHKIRFHLQVKWGETGNSGAKLRKVLLQISIYGVNVMDLKTRAILFKHPLNRISFCADDKQDKRVFSYIAKNDAGKHQCFVFLSDKMAENITLTIGEAFDLAYEKFIKKKGKDLENQKQTLLLKKRIAELEEKNKVLEARLQKCTCSTLGNNATDFLIPLSPIPPNPQESPSTNGLTMMVDKNSAPPPLPLAPPPRRANSQQSTSNILAEIFVPKDSSLNNQIVQPINLSDLFDDNFDPRADEKKDPITSPEKQLAETGQRNTVAEFEALLRRVDIQLAEVQNGIEAWKLERGDTGDTGQDWPVDGEESKDDNEQQQSSISTPANKK